VRVLLDEQIPVDLAVALQGHSVDTVVGPGWTGITNGELLRRMGTEYEALVTMDRGIEFQQNLAAASVGVLLVRARSNRIDASPATRPSHLGGAPAAQARSTPPHQRITRSIASPSTDGTDSLVEAEQANCSLNPGLDRGFRIGERRTHIDARDSDAYCSRSIAMSASR